MLYDLWEMNLLCGHLGVVVPYMPLEKKNLKQKPIIKSWVFIYWLIWFFVGWKSMIFLCNSASNLTITQCLVPTQKNGCHLCVLLHLHTSEFVKISTCLMYNHYWLISKYQFNLIFVPFWKDVSFSFKLHFTN